MALFNRTETPLSIDLPKGAADQPSWMRVGGIAIVGFVIGVAWPKIMGVRLGPNGPGESAANRAAAASSGADAKGASGEAPAAVHAAPNTPALPGEAGTAAPATAGSGVDVSVKNGVLISCKTEDGATLKGRACGTVLFDAIAHPRIQRLSQCPAARGAEGKLAVTFNLDFRTNRPTFGVGKATTVANPDALVACLKSAFESVSLSAVGHEHPMYAVLYTATFSSSSRGGSPASANQGVAPAIPAIAAVTPASDDPTAELVWEVTLVRDQPKNGQIVGRLLRGTKVRLGAAQNGWYPVRYGKEFQSEGFIYRAAIGR